MLVCWFFFYYQINSAQLNWSAATNVRFATLTEKNIVFVATPWNIYWQLCEYNLYSIYELFLYSVLGTSVQNLLYYLKYINIYSIYCSIILHSNPSKLLSHFLIFIAKTYLFLTILQLTQWIHVIKNIDLVQL